MSASQRPLISKRIIQIAILATIAISLTGCAYLRLLKFKNQLKEWDQYVQVLNSPNLTLEFKKPVVRDSDFIFITESQPTRKTGVSSDPQVEEWDWSFSKKGSTNSGDPFEMNFTTRFEDHLLTSIEFDPKLIEAIPEEFVTALFKSLGKAKIYKLSRQAIAKVATNTLANVPLPTMDDIHTVMGTPTIEQTKGQRHLARYVFNFYNPENSELSGQFELVFENQGEATDQTISAFQVSGRAR